MSDIPLDPNWAKDLARVAGRGVRMPTIPELELRMDTRLETLQGDTKAMKWMWGVIVAGVIALVMKSFFHA